MCVRTDLAFTLILSFRLRGTIYENLEIPKGSKSYLPINDESNGFVDLPTNTIDESTRYRRYRGFLVETERCNDRFTIANALLDDSIAAVRSTKVDHALRTLFTRIPTYSASRDTSSCEI